MKIRDNHRYWRECGILWIYEWYWFPVIWVRVWARRVWRFLMGESQWCDQFYMSLSILKEYGIHRHQWEFQHAPWPRKLWWWLLDRASSW